MSDGNCIVIDDLLQASVGVSVLPLFSQDGRWRDAYGLHRKATRGPLDGTPPRPSNAVLLDEWRDADDRQRFYHFLELDGPPQGRPIAGGWLSWLLLRHRLESPEFLALVSDVSGLKLGGLQSLKAHVMRRGHYLRPHSDRDGARRLCGALYLGDGWTAGYGGEFELLAGDDTVLSVEPRHNRLVLFDPLRHERHAVRVVTAEAGAWQRNSVSLWWGGEGL